MCVVRVACRARRKNIPRELPSRNGRGGRYNLRTYLDYPTLRLPRMDGFLLWAHPTCVAGPLTPPSSQGARHHHTLLHSALFAAMVVCTSGQGTCIGTNTCRACAVSYAVAGMAGQVTEAVRWRRPRPMIGSWPACTPAASEFLKRRGLVRPDRISLGIGALPA